MVVKVVTKIFVTVFKLFLQQTDLNCSTSVAKNIIVRAQKDSMAA